jgi:dolichol-phosphate mannosyltransferase
MSDSLVIIPTYNEKENIEKMIRKVLSLEPSFHVLLVDDGSPDGTGQIIKDLQKTFPDKLFLIERSGKLGLGTAYIVGFQWALAHHYHFIFEMDADFSHNPEDLIKLRESCANGADLAIGSRYKSGINVVNWPMSRVLLSFYASKYVQFVTGMPINDATAGFKCYRREVLQSIDFNKIKFVGYAFQIEMKFVTWKKGFNIIEVPIIFTDRSEGTSKMSKGIVKEAILGVIQMKLMSYFQKS